MMSAPVQFYIATSLERAMDHRRLARESIAAAGFAVMRWSDSRDAALGEE